MGKMKCAQTPRVSAEQIKPTNIRKEPEFYNHKPANSANHNHNYAIHRTERSSETTI